jgi:hypothetical protein
VHCAVSGQWSVRTCGRHAGALSGARSAVSQRVLTNPAHYELGLSPSLPSSGSHMGELAAGVARSGNQFQEPMDLTFDAQNEPWVRADSAVARLGVTSLATR